MVPIAVKAEVRIDTIALLELAFTPCACRKPHPPSSAPCFSSFRHPGMILGCGSPPRLLDHQPAIRVAAAVTAFRVVEDRGGPAPTSPARRVAAPGQRAAEDDLG